LMSGVPRLARGALPVWALLLLHLLPGALPAQVTLTIVRGRVSRPEARTGRLLPGRGSDGVRINVTQTITAGGRRQNAGFSGQFAGRDSDEYFVAIPIIPFGRDTSTDVYTIDFIETVSDPERGVHTGRIKSISIKANQLDIVLSRGDGPEGFERNMSQ